MSVKTQGTELYVVDPVNDAIIKVTCPTAITGLTGSRTQVDDSCLEDIAASFIGGRVQPGTMAVPINTDPAEPSHVRLHEIFRSGEKFNFAIGWGDFTGGVAPGPVPTGLDSAGEFILPSTRSWLYGNAYVSDYDFNFNADDIVRSTVTFQLSGFPEWEPKA